MVPDERPVTVTVERTVPDPRGCPPTVVRFSVEVDPADLDARGVLAVLAQVPEVDEPGRRLPRQHLSPLVLLAGRGALVDPPPARGSIATTSAGSAVTECERGHQEEMRRVHVSNAFAGEQATSKLRPKARAEI